MSSNLAVTKPYDAWDLQAILRRDVKAFPYQHLVPRGYQANVLWRKQILKEAANNEQMQKDLWLMCRRDLLFWCNGFLWTYNPRLIPNSTVVPFILYDFQQDIVFQVIKHIVFGRDMVQAKSRDMGLTYINLLCYLWLFQFYENYSFLCGSRKEDCVDDPGNMDALFPKIDFMLNHQPGFLRPGYDRRSLQFQNTENGCNISGESTNSNFGRSGRSTSIFLDEFAAVENGFEILASTRDVTACRLYVSTPQGRTNAFANRYFDGHGITRMRIHWSLHPDKAKGLYQSRDNELEVLEPDKGYEYPAGYTFIKDGKLRSPWYDGECLRAHSNIEILQELDIDFGASGGQVFDDWRLDKYKKEYEDPAWKIGNITVTEDMRVAQFAELDKGPLQLWCDLGDKDGTPPKDEYVIGIDISAGSEASNSVISVASRTKGKKVAEYCTPSMRPEELASVAVALAHWFAAPDTTPAYMKWDRGGPGVQFGAVVLETNYRNIYWQMDETDGAPKAGTKAGWHATQESKRLLIEDYRAALWNREFQNPSGYAIEECRQYRYAKTGRGIEHGGAKDTIDPSGANDNHGDRVIADALAWSCMKQELRKTAYNSSNIVPINSMMHRRLQAEMRRVQSDDPWGFN